MTAVARALPPRPDRGHLALSFATCVLPGCGAYVDQVGAPCVDCRAAFGSMLAEVPGGTPLDEAAIAARDEEVRAAYRTQAPAAAPPTSERWIPQVCWLCEQRKACQRRPAGWECRECQAVTG